MSPANKSRIDLSQVTWRERLAALRYVLPFFRLIWEAHRWFLILMIVLRILRSFVPLAALWTGKLIIDQVLAARSLADIAENPFLYAHLWELVALEFGIVVAGELLSRVSSLVESLTGDLFSNQLSVRLMQHASRLDLYQFENPEFYDRLERARRQTTGRIGLLPQFFQIAQDAFTLASLAAALLVFNPWLLLLLVVAVIPSFWERRITLRSNIHCFIAGRRRDVCSIIFVFSARATGQPKKCKCLIFPAG